MSATPEDVKVRLSPQGIEDITRAFRQIEREAQRTGKSSARAFQGLSAAATSLRRSITTLGIAGATTALVAYIKTTARLADEAGKTAAVIGTTATSYSVLRAEAQRADIADETLRAGLVSLVDSLGALTAGTRKQEQAFSRLGLSAQSFEGKDTAQAFALVATQVAKFGDSAAKTRAIIDIFGKKTGPQLIPLLNSIGEKGFEEAARQAERFGLVVSTETAAAANAVRDSFDIAGAQVRGLATQFLAGLAPVVATVMEDFREDTAGKGVTAMFEFGQNAGKVLRNVIGFFQVAGRRIAEIMARFKIEQETLGDVNDALRRGDEEAARRARALGEERKRAVSEAFDEQLDQLAAERAASEKRASDLAQESVEREKQRAALAQQLALLEKQEAAEEKRKKVLEEFQKLEEDIARINEEHAKNVARATEERSKVELDLLEATGRTREAKIAALDAELAKTRQIFAEAGQLTDKQIERLDALRNVKIAQINFEEVKTSGERALEDLAAARLRIQQDVELGIETQLGGEQRILDLERERLPVLQQLAAAALAAAQATGSPDAIAAAEAFAAQVNQVAISVNNIANEMAQFKNRGVESFQQALSSTLKNLKDFESVEDVFRSLASTILQSLADIAADILAKQATFALLRAFGGGFGFSGGGQATVNAATGGHIRGPGSGTSDSIPAWLSNGEFVVRAAAVREPGVLAMLHSINRSARLPRAGVRRFAEGGLVSKTPGGGLGTGSLEIGLESGLYARLIQNPDNLRLTIRELSKNRGAVQQAIGG